MWLNVRWKKCVQDSVYMFLHYSAGGEQTDGFKKLLIFSLRYRLDADIHNSVVATRKFQESIISIHVETSGHFL